MLILWQHAKWGLVVFSIAFFNSQKSFPVGEFKLSGDPSEFENLITAFLIRSYYWLDVEPVIGQGGAISPNSHGF